MHTFEISPCPLESNNALISSVGAINFGRDGVKYVPSKVAMLLLPVTHIFISQALF